MDIDSIIERHFKSDTKLACAAFGVTKAAISQWRKNGVPKLRQFHIADVLRKRRGK